MRSKLALSTLVGMLMVSSLPSTTFGGTIVVLQTDPKAVAVSTVRFTDGSVQRLFGTTPGTPVNPPPPGLFFSTISIPNEAKVTRTTLAKVFNGVVVSSTISISPPITLASAEPFRVPSFIGTNPSVPVVADIDLGSFLSSAFDFQVGQVYSVSNGLIAGAAGLTLLDGSSLPTDPATVADDLLDPSFVASLPRLTGTAMVAAFDTFAVPEPKSLSLFVLGIATSLGIGWGYRKIYSS